MIEGRLVTGKQTEIKEVKNAYEAYDRIMTFDPYAVKDFLKAHRLMTDGLERGTADEGRRFAGKFVEKTEEFAEKFVDNATQRSIIRLLAAQPTIRAKRIAEAVGTPAASRKASMP